MGLGMRLTKGDPTGSYSYLADGVSPASDVLSDGHTTFTPGVSEYNALGSRFYVADAQGNSRGLLDGGQNATDGYNWDAFGGSVSRFGSNPTALAWNEAAGYQSDGDSGLKLLGHRYYDSRTGRFISQDPAGDGDNWYAYCDNDPMNKTDPSGNVAQSVNGGDASIGGPAYGAALQEGFDASLDSALMYSEASYEVKSATIVGFSAQETQTIKDTLKAVLGTARGAEILSQGYNDGIHLDLFVPGDDELSAYANKAWLPGTTLTPYYQMALYTPMLKYIQFDQSSGYSPYTLPELVIHELGHAMTGIEDTGIGSLDNILANENPIRGELGLGVRNKYNDYIALPDNPFEFFAPYRPGHHVPSPGN